MIRKKYATKGNIFEAPALIADKARDILRHYVANILPNGYKAQVVAYSRLASMRYFDALQVARDELLAEAEAIAAAPHMEEAFDNWKSRVDELARRVDQARLSVGHQAELSRKMGEFREIIATHTKQKRKQASSATLDTAAELLESAPVVNGITVVVGNVPDSGAEQLRNAIDWIRRKAKQPPLQVPDGEPALAQ